MHVQVHTWAVAVLMEVFSWHNGTTTQSVWPMANRYLNSSSCMFARCLKVDWDLWQRQHGPHNFPGWMMVYFFFRLLGFVDIIVAVWYCVSHISFLEALTLAFTSSVAIITLAGGDWLALICGTMHVYVHTCHLMHAVLWDGINLIVILNDIENVIRLGHENKLY